MYHKLGVMKHLSTVRPWYTSYACTAEADKNSSREILMIDDGIVIVATITVVSNSYI